MDVIDPRVDVGAQRAIFRMRRGDAAARADAETLLGAVKTGLIAGIYGDDLRAAAHLAARRGTVRWQLVPRGFDAALIDVPDGPSTIIFRELAREDPLRLDPALRRLAPLLRPRPRRLPPPGVPVLLPAPNRRARWVERERLSTRGFTLANVGPTPECPSRCGTDRIGAHGIVVPWICRITGLYRLGPAIGVRASATGTLIGPCHVLTAGHFVHSLVRDLAGAFSARTVTDVEVVPRDHDRLPPLFGRFKVVRARPSRRWVSSGATDERFDFGLLTLDRPAPPSVGRWHIGPGAVPGTQAFPVPLSVVTGGYSEQCPPARRQHYRTGRVATSGDVVDVALESSSGHSGSPTWTLDFGLPTLRGLLVSTNVVPSTASGVCDSRVLAIRQEILAELRSWVDEDIRQGACPRGPNIFLPNAVVQAPAVASPPLSV